MITPPCWSIMCRAAAWAQKNTLLKLISIARRHSVDVISRDGLLIDTPETPLGVSEGSLDRDFVGDRGLETFHPCRRETLLQRALGVRHGLGVDVDQQQMCAVAGKTFGQCQADATTATGHYHDFAGNTGVGAVLENGCSGLWLFGSYGRVIWMGHEVLTCIFCLVIHLY